ncbi:orotidine 5'-phosphate decarboxylase [Roseivivax halodurans JCM 10272]|uniref:Orotidine 5'-phosphate decarboxylase n=1 Tax=Roseivivax halodurans JCM 10272 TaxID=1449350 RepID=X7EG84_9RHOB|nr:orotidine-5'-phosphate decarboxylase [Roseivivax halodurans]ETX14902.1 orotidine 5'-phosphate decarboxylase [Roseivivax halodurans JCM 10272]
MSDNRLIVALDVADALTGLTIAQKIGEHVNFYKIGLAMLTGGGLALANELKDQHGKRILLDLKLYESAGTIETAVRGLARNGIDALTVHGDPHVVRAAKEGASGTAMQIYAVTMLSSLGRADLDANLMRDGDPGELAAERAARAFDAGADGVICAAGYVARVRALSEAAERLIVAPNIRVGGSSRGEDFASAPPRDTLTRGADHIVIGQMVTGARDPAGAARSILAEIA